MNLQGTRLLDEEVAECWSCKGPVSPRALFCSVCGGVQPPRAIDHFARLGLRPGYEIDVKDLERQYFGFQRRLHPDRFATRSPREKALSQQQATALNEAYETLKDPLKRAAYLLKISGRKSEIDESATITDPELLMEAMGLREELAEADCFGAVAAILTRVERDALDAVANIGHAFAKDDLDRAIHLTTRLKYLTKMADEARARKTKLMQAGS